MASFADMERHWTTEWPASGLRVRCGRGVGCADGVEDAERKGRAGARTVMLTP